jgi:pilus assembly protein CpaB
MQRGGQLLIVLGLILALITAGLVYTATQVPVNTTAKIPMVDVVVAVQDISERVEIQAPMLATKQWPADSVPTGIITGTAYAVGKASVTKIYAGELLLTGKLVDAKLAGALTFLVPPGMVAFTVPSSEGTAVAGAIQQGDFVDVLLTLKVKDVDIRNGNESQELATTQLTLQDVKVIGVGVWTPPQQAAPAASGQAASAQAAPAAVARTLTVLVTEQDALVLKYAKESGQIDLALRPFNDHETVKTDSVYLTYMVDRFNFNKPPIIVRSVATPVVPK